MAYNQHKKEAPAKRVRDHCTGGALCGRSVAPDTVMLKSRLLTLIMICLLSGMASGVDFDELTQAAMDGDAESQFQLAIAYDIGEGVPKNLKDAAKWYREAAEQGHAQAQNSLGSLYQAGLGVPIDYEEAFRWYEAAANHDLANAKNNLAYMYDLGLGVKEDDSKAVSLYQAAAEAGEVQSMVNLAAMYSEGTGVTMDNATAYMWIDLARFYTQRSENMDLKWYVRGRMDELKGQMSRSEIKQGKKMSKEWSKVHQT